MADERIIYPQYEKSQLLLTRRKIAEHVARTTKVIDFNAGYVVCEDLNHSVDPRLLRGSAEVITGSFLSLLPPELQPLIVIGVPNRGKELATAISLETGLRNGVTERLEMNGEEKPKFKVTHDRERDMVVIEGVRSFTKPGKIFYHTIRGLHPGSVVLVADDFSATGHATEQYEKAFAELGITGIFVYMAAKDFDFLDPRQIGYRLNRNAGKYVFAVTLVTNMNRDTGKVITIPEDIY